MHLSVKRFLSAAQCLDLNKEIAFCYAIRVEIRSRWKDIIKISEFIFTRYIKFEVHDTNEMNQSNIVISNVYNNCICGREKASIKLLLVIFWIVKFLCIVCILLSCIFIIVSHILRSEFLKLLISDCYYHLYTSRFELFSSLFESELVILYEDE